MIIDFSVSNFRSIYEKVSLSMLASKLTGKEDTKENYFYPERYKNFPILKSAVIYGANASGKSNLLKALAVFRSFIINSTDAKFGEGLEQEPFRLHKIALDEPTSFEMMFITKDHIRYKYGFSYDKQDILEEYLYSYASLKETKLFVRKKGEKIQFSSQFRGEKKVLEDQLLNNILLLSKAANSNYLMMQDVYSYFKDNFLIFDSNYDSDYRFSNKISVQDEVFKKGIIDFLKVADTGIEGFNSTKEEVPENLLKIADRHPELKDHLLESAGYDTDVFHRIPADAGTNELVKWDLEEESSGTIKLFAMAGPMIDILQKGGVLIIDEINNGLHPLISEFIVRLFNNPQNNPKNAQLIFTTHDTTLLNKHLFRRDQIWFTEKNNLARTQLFSLGSFDKKEVRWDVPFDRWYLSGRFGALPTIADLQTEQK